MTANVFSVPRSSHGRDAHATDILRQFIAPALVFIVACLDRQYQTDFWLHLARGCEIVGTGAWISVEHFTRAAGGQAVRDPNWLSQVIYCRLFALGGLKLVQTVNAAVLAIAFWLLARLCRRGGASWRAAGAATVVTFLLGWQTFLIRPQTFSMLLFVLLYGVLTDSNRKRALFWPPLILLLWANLHGGFVIGLCLIGVFVLSEAIQFDGAGAALFGTSLTLSALATLINPYGWRIYQYAYALTATVLPRHIEEWLPPPLSQWIGQAFVGSAVLLIVLHLLARRRPTVRESLLLLCFFLAAAHAVRMVIWWALAIAPILASLLNSIERREEVRLPRSSIIAGGLCAALLAICVGSLPWLERWNPVFATVRSPHRVESDLDAVARARLLPSRAGEALIFTRMEWAQYLDWRLGPCGRVFIDNHVELFSDRTWQEYCNVSAGADDWAKILNAYGVDYLLLDVTYHSHLLSRVLDSGDWEQSFRAGDAILFVRRGAMERAGGLHRKDVKGRYTDSAVLCLAIGAGLASSTGMSAPRQGSFGGNRQFYGR